VSPAYSTRPARRLHHRLDPGTGVDGVDADRSLPVLRWHKAHLDRRRPHAGEDVAAGRPVVDQPFGHGDLGEEVVDLAALALGRREHRDLGGHRGATAEAVDVPGVARADHGHQNFRQGRAILGQIGAAKVRPA
jgi:hypothetical protein